MTSPYQPIYDTIGLDYTTNRQPEPAWAALMQQLIGSARHVVNIGAGTGSYEPDATSGIDTVAVEPSAVMLAQRQTGAAPAVRARGDFLPLRSGSFDFAMAILTLHHWGDWATGLAEMRRVAPRRLILTIDFEVHARFWLLDDYLPEVGEYVRSCSPDVHEIAAAIPLTGTHDLPLPADMRDGVLGAHWRRPEAYLDPIVRANTSPLALADPAVVERGVARLRADLASGEWHRRYADLLSADRYDLGYRLLVSEES